MVADALDISDTRTVLQAEDLLLKNLVSAARILGEIGGPVTKIENNLILQPSYLNLRRTLIEALRPFPDARRAAARAIASIESSSAAQPSREPIDIEGTDFREAAPSDVADDCRTYLPAQSGPRADQPEPGGNPPVYSRARRYGPAAFGLTQSCDNSFPK